MCIELPKEHSTAIIMSLHSHIKPALPSISLTGRFTEVLLICKSTTFLRSLEGLLLIQLKNSLTILQIVVSSPLLISCRLASLLFEVIQKVSPTSLEINDVKIGEVYSDKFSSHFPFSGNNIFAHGQY